MKIEFKRGYQLVILAVITILVLMLYEIGEDRLRILKAGIEQGVLIRDFNFWLTFITVVFTGFFIKFVGILSILLVIGMYVTGNLNIVEPHFHIKETQNIIIQKDKKENVC